jgi:sec-independent protein translocase protein TatB
MFDISWTEILVIGVVALIAIGPRELPRVLFELGKWVRRLRAMAGEFQRHFSDMMHEAELDELRRQAQAVRDLSEPGKLAEWVDPGGTLRHGLDPTNAGATGHFGSPLEQAPSSPGPAEAALPPVPMPMAPLAESPPPVAVAPVAGAATGSGRG